MKLSSNSDISSLQLLKFTMVFWVLTFLSVQKVAAHGTQVEYCFTNNGMVRIYIEHWHGNVTNFSQSIVNMTITVNGVPSTMNVPASGYVHNTAQADLPDCSSPTVQLSECTDRSDLYNDWAYFDFPAPDCYNTLVIRVNSVIDPTYVLLECGASRGGPIYPAETPELYVEDELPPYVECGEELPDIVLTCGDAIPEPEEITAVQVVDDCTEPSDLILTVSDVTTGTSCTGPMITRTYTFTDEFDRETDCLQLISYAPDDEGPVLVCPSDLTIGCDDPSAQNLIDAWLASYNVSDNCSTDITVVNSYTESGFSYIPSASPEEQNSVYNLGMSSWPIVNQALKSSLLSNLESSIFFIKETTNSDQYDKVISTKLKYLSGMSQDFSDVLIIDSEDRLLPIEIEAVVPGESAKLKVKIPELKAGQNNRFKLLYGASHEYDLSFDADDIREENSGYLIISDFLSNSFNRNKINTEAEDAAVMGCNCTASQGGQSFPINAIQNPRDDVEFYIYGNSGTSQAASSNTTFECNDQAVIFLYENTLTGEVSLFILLDAAGGGNGGSGSLDFYCLPATATLDYSDDRGEISGIFPTVTAFWRWANCCTDGAVIGNVGCDQTFDVYPDFISGINAIKWVSGTPTAPIYNTFNNITDPIRISCGNSNPSCCPNTNQVTITNATCPSSDDGSIDVTPDVTGGPYNFEWSTGATTEDISGLEPGDYTVTILDDNACEQISTFTVAVETTPELTCVENQTVLMSGTSVILEEGVNVLYTVDYNCPDDYDLVCVGCEAFNCADQNTVQVVTLTVTDKLSNTDECTINVTIQNLPPVLNCPSDLTVGCVDPNGDDLIENWLTTVTSVDPEGGNLSVNDNYDEANFNYRITDDRPQQVSGKQSFDEGPKGHYLNFFESLNFSAPPPSSGTQVVTFTATDDCGNTSTCEASIIIVDNTDPIITCPSAITIECGDPNNDAILTNWMDNATATDVCDDNLVITNNFTALSTQVCGGVATVIFTATDSEGNTASCTSTATHEDSTAPEFLMKPQDVTVECTDVNGADAAIDAWTAANGNGMAVDDCDQTVSWAFTLDAQDQLCGYTYLRTYTFTITDDCGNSSTSLATALVEDTTPPVINLVWDELIQTCTANNETNLATYLEQNRRATDVCSDASDVTIEWVLFNDVSSCGGTIDRTYLYTATDACGNTSTDYFHYMTTDSAIPTWANVPGTLVVECGDEDNPLIITQWMQDVEESMFDACGGELSISNNFTGDLTDICNQNTVVTWTVTDECGNSRELTRSIAVRDTENPIIINCPDDFTVNVDVANCSSNVIFSTPIGYDQCTDVVTMNQILGPSSGSSFPIGTTAIVFEAVDDCGRRSDPDCEFNITVEDSLSPTLACPSNDVEVCADAGTCAWIGDDSLSPMAMENCATANITYTVIGATTSSGNNTAIGLTYQFGISTICYTVTDASANSSSCCFDVVVSDCEAPTITCPEDITVACEESSESVVGSGQLVWDHNGNGGTSYAGVNNIPSAVSSVTDISFGDGLQLLNSAAQPVNIPNGTNSEHILTDVATNSYAAAKGAMDYVEICFTMSSDGFLTQVQQGIIPSAWGGSGAGSFKVAAEISSDGFMSNTLLYQDAQITDPNATGNYTLYQENISHPLSAGQTYKIRYYLYDEQNNASLFSGTGLPNNTVAFDDLQLTIQEVMITGNGAELSDWIDDATGSDNCAGSLAFTSQAFNTISSCGNTNTTVYQFTVADLVGNETQCLASFTIEDTVEPVITTPAAPGDSDCENANADLLDWLNNFGYAEATDECGTVSWSHDFNGGAMTGCSGVTSLMVTFTATDECGNTATTQANFNVDDTEAPEITCPSNITLECGDVLNDAVIELWLQSVTAVDNCTAPEFNHNYPDAYVVNCGTTGMYTVTFEATDDCDNTSDCEAIITIEDTTPPLFLVQPQDLIVECGPSASDPAAWLSDNGGALASDQCDINLTWTVVEGASSSGCGDSETIEYIFTVTDDCGNASFATAQYVFEDTASPTVIPPSDITVECSAVATSLTDWQAGAMAADDCGDGFTFEAILFNTISGCGDSMVEVYQFTATDACGNQGTALASYTIEDTSLPAVTCPAPLVLECGDENNNQLINEWLESATGNDTCGDVTFSENFNGTLPANCGGVVAVTFTVSDDCDNTSSCIVNMSMDDTALPDFDNCPSDMTVNVDPDLCGSNPVFSTPFAVDNCNVTVVQTAGIASGNTFPLGTTPIEFTATDDCGNTALCQFDLTVDDVDVPLILCPGGSNNICVDDGTCVWTSENIAPVLGQENCAGYDISYTITNATTGSGVDDASGTIFNVGMSVTCYTITDSSGNSSSCCFHVYVADCEPPVVTCPAPLSVECDGSGNTADLSLWLEDISALDNCDDTQTFTSEVYNTISDCGGSNAVTYRFTATDDSDNSSFCLSTFTIEDTESPIIDTAAEDLTVDCAGGSTNAAEFTAWLNNNGGAVASDVCSDLVWSNDFTSELSDLCGETGAISVTFTATDACGNTEITSAIFTITDNTAPVISCPSPIVLECNDPVNDAVITTWLTTGVASDVCSAVTITNTYPNVSTPDCGDTGFYDITFTATDDCGNTSSCNSTITIEDTVVPTFELAPSDLILECADGSNAALINAWITNGGYGSASDQCSEITWSNQALATIATCGLTSTTPYVFTVTDACGNTSTRMASVITENNTDPIIIPPADLVVECDGTGNLTDLNDWLEDVVGTSDCGTVSTEYELYNTISTCGGGSERVFLFRGTDACGNESTDLASFTIEDSSTPTAVCPPTLILECGLEGNDQAIAAWLLSANVADATGCSGFGLTNNFNGTLPGFICDGDSGSVVQFTATDDCGNTGVCQSLITLNDTQPPAFANCPTDMTVNVDASLCSTNVVYSQPVALDVCDNSVEVILTSGVASGAVFPIGSTTILFTATDDCGNTMTCTFNMEVQDLVEPTISCPSNKVTVCTDAGTCAWEATDVVSAIYTENCDALDINVKYDVSGATTVSSSLLGINDIDEDNVIFAIGESEVCYAIEDGAGNQSSCCFTVNVEDCESPEITCPADIVVECDGADNATDLSTWLMTLTSTDNCTTIPALSNQKYNSISACGATNTRVFEFSSVDDFGNRSTCFAEFTVQDTSDPDILVEASDLIVECSGTGNSASLTAWLNDFGGATASDICNEIEWTHNFTEPLSASCAGSSMTTVVFTATDDCGNKSTTSADFIIEDTTAPVIDCPANIILECGANINPAIIESWLNGATAFDSCSEVVVDNDYGTVFVDDCGETGVHTIVFTATDDCDNTTTCSRTITIEDTTVPTIESPAQDLVLECVAAGNAGVVTAWETNNGQAIATDACSDETLTWTIINQVTSGICGAATTTIYTFQVEDNCGNASTTQAAVIFEDTTTPVLTVPVDQVEECGAIVVDVPTWLGEATATNDCGAVTVVSELWNTISGCGGTESMTYLFTATDACGNVTTGLADYTIEDTSLPTPVCPATLALMCGSENNDQTILAWLNSATTTDANDCSSVELTNDYPDQLPLLICDGSLGTPIVFTATDACGNSSSCSSIITMDDMTDPYFSNCPLSMVVNVDVDLCETNVVYSLPVALDDCDENVAVVLTSGIPSGSTFPIGTTTLLYTATDNCDNASTCQFDITVVDSNTPSISCPSNAVYVCTDATICTWEATDVSSATFADNCADEGYTVIYAITGATTATSAITGVNDVDTDNVVFNLGVSEVCYTITDEAANSAQCCFDIIVEDCELPMLTCSDVLNVACGSEDLTAWYTTIAATMMDNCNTNAELVLDTLLLTDFSSCGSTIERVYMFVVTDESGNTSSCLATYETDDRMPPVITDASNLTIECTDGSQSTALLAWLQDNGGASFISDNCSAEVTWTNNYQADLVTSCGVNGATLVTFTATDDCGNTSTTQATFTIEDNTPPVLSCPQNITLECSGSNNSIIIQNWISSATSEDACQGTLEVVDNYGDVFVDACGETGVHTVIFTSTDACTNLSTCSRTITIEDTTSPVIEAAATDLLLSCAAIGNDAVIAAWEMNSGGALATDACSDETLVWTIQSQVTIGICGGATSTLYTFLVTDNCGNTSTTQASVIIEDRTAPELIVPEDQVEECGAIVVDVATWRAEVTGSDSCSVVSFSSVLWNTTSGCGGTETETYLFTATDACGNETTGFADYIIEDSMMPVVSCPSALSLICGNESNDQIILNWLSTATTTDPNNCSSVEITNDIPSSLPILTCEEGLGTPIMFTATDACGNSSSCTAVITMDDMEAPYFRNCPQIPMTVNVDVDLCETNVVYSLPVALDDCDENVAVALTSGIPSGSAFPIGTTTLLYTATDDCDNTSTCQFDITVVDSDTPSISCPSNAVYVCTDVTICTWEATDVSSATFADNCADEGYAVTYAITGATTATSAITGVNDVDADNVIFNLGASEVCYTISDEAANSAQCCFDIIVEDCELPTLTCSDVLNVACGSEDLTAWYTTIAATMMDNCNTNAELVLDTLLLTDFSSCGSTIERVYMFVVTDESGNTSSCLATYETDDTMPPVITDATNLTIECTDGSQSTALLAWLQDNGGASFTSDNCSAEVTWTNNYQADLVTSCGVNGATLVTFTATDACGNTSTTQATFTIEDNTPPALSCPQNITLECSDAINDVIIHNWISRARSEDACQGTLDVLDNFGEVFAGACGETGAHTVTFTSADACDNISTCDRTITIIDTTNPEIDVLPQDLVIECADDDNASDIQDWEMRLGGAAATDACSDEALIWNITEQVNIGSCGSTSSTLYTFQVTDNCGNTSTAQASVIVEDNTAPDLILPESQVEECGSIVVDVATWLAEVSGTDECGDITLSSVLWNTVSGCGGTDSQTYLFTATDACGNETTGFADYLIQDTSDPVITCPDDLALICGNEGNDQTILRWLNAATAVDTFDCSQVNVSSDYPSALPVLDCNNVLGTAIVFEATDECGNTVSCTATITMDDNTAPYFSNCPIDMTVNVDSDRCSNNVVYSQPIALDNCDEMVDVALIDGVPAGNPFPLGLTTITFEAADQCGNTSTCSFDVTVEDSDVPSVFCPSNDVVVCTDIDACMWLSTDQTDPIYNDNCPGQILSYDVLGATVATSADSGENLVADDAVVFNLGESYVTYEITDPAGNQARCNFTVIVEDCQNPTIVCSDEINVACGSEDVSAWYNTIAATVLDNCDAIPTLRVDTLLLTDFSSCGATFNRTYLYTVTDQAGNTASCVANYETDDNVPPTIDIVASDLVLECVDSNQSTALLAWLNNNGGAVASDACTAPVVWTNDFVGDLTTSCGGNGGVLVTFTATDACGNTATTTANFIIQDTTTPALSCPGNLVLECSYRLNDAVIANWLRTATAIDECEGKTAITNNFPSVFVDGCGLTGVYTVTFETTDNCDNSTSCDRTITLVDTTSPDIYYDAEDLVLDCSDPNLETEIQNWITNNGNALAIDVCSDEPLVWTYEEGEQQGDCGGMGSTEYVFTVTDNCGNSSTTSAVIYIVDETNPVFDTPPANIVIECYPVGNQVALFNWLNNNGGAVVSDECTTDFAWEYDLINVVDNCGNTIVRVYRFTVTDDCGNSSTAEANFEIHDTTSPDILSEAEDIFVECSESANSFEIINWLNNNGNAIATDRCGNVSWTNDYGTVVADCGATGGVLVTFTATDECGNTSTTAANFVINDDTAPVWTLLPQNLEVECDGSSDPMGQIEAWLNIAGGAEAEDACSVISFSNDFSVIDLECNMQGGVEVIFTVTDACSNASTASAMLAITDDVPPVITREAANEIVECDGAGNTIQLQAWLDAHGNAEAEDACSAALIWTYTLRSEVEACGQTTRSIYDFTATDACGNVSVITMGAFVIEDTTDPVFDILPVDETVECDGQGNDAELAAWLANSAGAAASDICSEPLEWTYDLVMDEDSCGITGIQVFRFTITDNCGNNYSEEATFIIEDTTSPDLTPGEDMNMEECDNDIAGNILDFDFWLTSNAGATATDDCGNVTWTNNYNPTNWVNTCGNTRYVDVLFTATDDCGNSSTTEHRFGVGDLSAPTFINCPRPPVVTDAPDAWCSAYVNYATPIAEDNCSDFTVTQVDDSGLQSGDLFPVGLTIISFVAEDECGNTSSCELKIIVNDFHTPPTIVCPENIAIENDPSICGAVVNDIAPVTIEDNCLEHSTVVYELKDASGATISCGFENASGELFPVGQTTVEYTIQDQPLLLITEIVQDGTTTAVELTNFGPAQLDITCLDITREGPDVESHNVPNGIVLNVGDTYVQEFSDIPATAAAGYYLSFVGTIIDGVSINGHAATNYTFDGAIFGEDISRSIICDHDNADDFTAAISCFAGSLGELNPGLTTMTANGSAVALQEAVPSISSCSFDVVVTDIEPAYCAQYDSIRVCLPSVMTLAAGACAEVEFQMSGGITVGDVNLVDLVIDVEDASALSFHLTSPQGTTIYLFENLCFGLAGVDINLDDTADNPLTTILCDPLGQGLAYQPIGDFSDFYNESAAGTWILSIANAGTTDAELQNVCLEVLELVPYSQADVYLENDLGECGANYTWQHPQYSDNCGAAIMTVTYESEDNIALPASGDVIPGTFESTFFEVGTINVVYTITDQYGNKSICGFEVVVEDTELPNLAPGDCQDQTIQLAAFECFVPTTALSLPPVVENCETNNLVFSAFADGLPSGEHDLILGFVDGVGNGSECQFTVTVLPFEPPSDQMSCIGQVNLSLDASCEQKITADMLLAPGVIYGCVDDFCIEITDQNGDEVVDAIATEEHIGQLLTVKICTDCNGGNCCWGNILVENKVTPEIACPKTEVSIVCNQVFDPSVVGEPILETCEQEVYFSYEDNITYGDMCDDFPGSIERTWTITDESNNTIQCVQEITIERFDINEVTFPKDTIVTTAEINCIDVAEDPSLIHPNYTGYPDLDGVSISETGDGLCSHFWNWDDQILFNCEGSYEILRKWLVRDMCSPIDWGVNPIEYYQSIKVIDNMPPQFEGCQEGVVVARADFDCSTDVYLNDYMPTITDACGAVKDTVFSVSPGTVIESPANSGKYYLTNMAPGIHTVKITVRDQCSNYNRCTFDVEVEDKTGPQVICEQDVHVALNSTGTVQLPAEVLDDGSFDNCTAIKYQIMRITDACDNPADLEPGDYVTLCCNDVSTEPIQLMLRVWDDADANGMFGTMGDYHSDCMVRVYVSDSQIPQLTCPADMTIDCNQDYTNLNVTGQPSIGSACSFAEAAYTDNAGALTECATGAVIRTWNITGYDVACEQIISIQAAVPFTENEIVWPADFEGDCSDMNTAVAPMVDSPECAQIGVDVQSDTFFFSEAACYKVINTWEVIDWCQYDSAVDPNVGKWTHQQVIKIVSSAEPTISGCGDIFVDVLSEDCTVDELVITNAAVDNSCGAAQILAWNYQIDKNGDGLMDEEGSYAGNVPSVTVTDIPGGSLTVIWQVADGCGNSASCTQQVFPRDGKSPAAYCNSVSTVVMESVGTVELWASDLDAGSADNCTATEDLVVSFDSEGLETNRTFSCADIPNGMFATIPVTVYITDEVGNQSSCVTEVILTDGNNACADDDSMMMVVGGRVVTEQGQELTELETYLKSTNATQEDMVMTDSLGNYYFDEVAMSGDYEVAPFKNDDILNGISTRDLIYIQRHILGLQYLDSPYKIIAADVTGDDKVNGLDLVQLRKLILGQIDSFHNNTSWRFVDEDFVFVDSLQPFPFDETISLDASSQASMDNNFIGVKIGDVNGSADVSGRPVAGRSRMELYYSIEAMSQEHKTLIPVYTNDSGLIHGFQFALALEGGQILDVLPGSVDLSEVHFKVWDTSKVAFSWHSELGTVSDIFIPLFYLSVDAAEMNSLSLGLMKESPKAEIYLGEALTVKVPSLSLKNGNGTSPFLLYQNEPNPFKDNTTIRFYLPEAQDITLSFFGPDGTLIYSILDFLEEGEHSYQVSADQFEDASVIYYQLSSELFNGSKKMILVK